MKFMVTYCSASEEAGSNPLHHASLVASIWHGEEKKLEATNAWGFYSVKSTTSNPLLSFIKQQAGITFDLQDNQGDMRKEEMRSYSVGKGLSGITFELSFEQYVQLHAICNSMIKKQKQANNELSQLLEKNGRSPQSYEIYREELKRARDEKREPRLKPFHFQVSLFKNQQLFSFAESSTCKTTALGILKKIGITEKQLARITSNGKWPALPRFGGKLDDVYFFEEGEKQYRYQSARTGRISYYRKWQDKGTHLFHAISPLNQLPAIIRSELQTKVSHLLQIEKVLNNQDDKISYNNLQSHIRDLYLPFSIAPCPLSTAEMNQRLEKINAFLSDIDWAIIDNWDDPEEIVSVVNFLPDEAQKAICRIQGYSFVKDQRVTSDNLKQAS